MANWQEPAKRIPKSDPQIVRVDMTKDDLAGRNVPKAEKASDLSIRHVPNAGSKG